MILLWIIVILNTINIPEQDISVGLKIITNLSLNDFVTL